MRIKRDFLSNFNQKTTLEAVALLGPRQVGKSTTMLGLQPKHDLEINLDDTQKQYLAKADPALLLADFKNCAFIDEIHLAPQLFFELKKQIDLVRRKRLDDPNFKNRIIFKITGSNMTDLDSQLKESMAGRISLFYMLGLSYQEIMRFDPTVKLSEVIFKGGFPELYIRPELNIISYLNDYIRNFIEKDVARSAGIEKIDDFLMVLKLLANNTGQILNYDNLASNSSVKNMTIKSWIGVLKKNFIIYTLPVYSNNLSKRLTKSPKIYFLDLGVCVRLQGHIHFNQIKETPQMGSLFENFVLTELIKFKLNFQKEFEIYLYRTKEKEEIDFILTTINKKILIEVKMAAQNVKPIVLSGSAKKLFGESPKVFLVTYGGEHQKLAENQYQIPIKNLNLLFDELFAP